MLDETMIKFDRPNKTYFAGEEVTGCVRFCLDRPLVARSLKISWKGRARTDFHKKGTKTYLNSYTMAWQSKGGEHKLPAGNHKFPFSFRIPSDCPPSLIGNYGDIKYQVKVELDRPWHLTQEVKKGFKVSINTTKTPIEGNMLKACRFQNHRHSGAIYSDGVFTMKINLPKRVFVPGETLRAFVELHNNTSKTIVKLRSELVAQAHYHSRPQRFQCSMATAKNCPLPEKHRRDEEDMIQKGEYPVNVKPYQATLIQVEVDLSKNWDPSFDSELISYGFLWCFIAKTDSLTGNELNCNARITVVPKQEVSSENKKRGTREEMNIPPPPYSPRND